MMTPSTVFVNDNKEGMDEFKSGLSTDQFKPASPIIPKPSTNSDIESQLVSLFSTNELYSKFFNKARHYSGMMKSKKDSKDQFQKVFDIYIMSLEEVCKTPDELERVRDIKKTIETTIIEIDNFTKDGNMSNEYFKVGLAALLTKLL